MTWIPIRFNQSKQACGFCGAFIPLLHKTKGNRTVGWFETEEKRWECNDCRAEGARADDARKAARALFTLAAEFNPDDAETYDLVFSANGAIMKGHEAFAQAYHAGECSKLKAAVFAGPVDARV